MDYIHKLVTELNNLVWGVPMLVLILGTGLFLMVMLRGMPIRRIVLGFCLMWQGRSKDVGAQGHVSSFQALMTGLSATVGTGNIAGSGRFPRVRTCRPKRSGRSCRWCPDSRGG